jgi:hypothetical protein
MDKRDKKELRLRGPVEFGVLESDIYYTSGVGYVPVVFRDSIDDNLIHHSRFPTFAFDCTELSECYQPNSLGH